MTAPSWKCWSVTRAESAIVRGRGTYVTVNKFGVVSTPKRLPMDSSETGRRHQRHNAPIREDRAAQG